MVIPYTINKSIIPLLKKLKELQQGDEYCQRIRKIIEENRKKKKNGNEEKLVKANHNNSK